ncbi:Lysophospholipase 3 [Grifola frondosa]|uniref:Lysophospholipase n=1 Tax=Grifola frondosa TaxID=5627 RepID=A0A1C7M329_GRIFR|nr:Lysophospholipase 3 [Grifola frondosa]
MFGAGILNALDGRNPMSLEAGIGGLLQTASYLSGLSGGSWFVGSLAQANFPTIPELVFGPSNVDVEGFGGWMTDKDILELSSDVNVTQAYVSGLVEEVMGKHAAGFPVTTADVLGRTFSRHFVNGTNALNFLNNKLTHGAGITFSSIVNISSFANHMQPFPILMTDTSSTCANDSVMLNASDAFVPLSNPIFELNVFEMGSFDPMLAAFIPMKYLGSSNNTICVSNFDQMSFIEATSSNLFNIYDLLMQAPPYSIEVIFDLLAQLLPEPSVPIAQTLIPNPFSGSAYFANSNKTYLSLVDGSEDGEMMPIQPLLVKSREVDTIFAIDGSGQTDDNFADGSSLIATQDRVSLFPSHYSFPPVPSSPSTLASSNLTKHPTFFGCNSNTSAPLVIYFANGGPPLGQPAITNISVHSTSIPIHRLRRCSPKYLILQRREYPSRRRWLC